MLTVAITFPWGRYYAHPWGLNPQRLREPEWPPSPWRLLRAIAAAWFRLHTGQPASPELLNLLNTLGRELPEMDLPKVAFSRTVHYQPNYGVTTDKDDQSYALYKRVRHENHFAAVAGPVSFHYRLATLPESGRASAAAAFCRLLTELAPAIQYFGRAESVSEFGAVVDDGPGSAPGLAVPALNDEGEPCRRIGEDCREVFCANPRDFRAEDLWQPRNGSSAGAVPHLVEDLLGASQPLPDGAAWFSYQMPVGWPREWIVRSPATSRRQPSAGPKPIVARFLRFSLQCRIGIPRKFVVSLSEQFRNQAIGLHGDPSYALSGHHLLGGAVADHQHAFYLPQPDDSGKYLAELCVWCRHGFAQSEVEALMRAGAVRFGDGRYPVRPVLLEVQRDVPLVETARIWRSISPFVPPRYWYRQKVREQDLKRFDTPEAQLGRCLRDAGVQGEATVRRLQTGEQWEVCRVHVPKASSLAEPDRRIGVSFEVEFSGPTALPFPAFGHSCHFGLGQFRAVPG
jgi:CRISPR-associated protein Csb2